MCSAEAVDKYEKSKVFISADNYGCYFPIEKALELACCILLFEQALQPGQGRE